MTKHFVKLTFTKQQASVTYLHGQCRHEAQGLPLLVSLFGFLIFQFSCLCAYFKIHSAIIQVQCVSVLACVRMHALTHAHTCTHTIGDISQASFPIWC